MDGAKHRREARLLSGDDERSDAGSPGAPLARLCELAARDQWRLDDLDWSALDLSSLPEPFRQTAADAFAQLHWGERTAHLAATRLVDLLPAGAARAFCLTQVADEARHMGFFEQAIGLLGCEGRVRPSVRRLMREVEDADTPEALLLGMQILIEGVAHSMFTEAARLVNALGAGGELDGPLGALRTVIGEWMPRLLARDESRHITFGLQYLRERIPQLGRDERQRLEVGIARWGGWVREQALDPDLVYGIGVDGQALCGQLIADLNLRIGQVGLQTRIAPLSTA